MGSNRYIAATQRLPFSPIFDCLVSNLSRNENFYFAALVFYRNRHKAKVFNRMSDSLSDLLMIAGKNKQTKNKQKLFCVVKESK